MKNLKPFGPSIGRSRISKDFINKLNKEFDGISRTKKKDYSSKLASQINNEVNFSKKYVDKNYAPYLKKNNKKVFK